MTRRFDDAQVARMVKMYKATQSIKEVALAFNVSVNKVRALIEQAAPGLVSQTKQFCKSPSGKGGRWL